MPSFSAPGSAHPPDGLSDGECKERGMVAALMGARPRLGPMGGDYDDHEARKRSYAMLAELQPALSSTRIPA